MDVLDAALCQDLPDASSDPVVLDMSGVAQYNYLIRYRIAREPASYRGRLYGLRMGTLRCGGRSTDRAMDVVTEKGRDVATEGTL